MRKLLLTSFILTLLLVPGVAGAAAVSLPVEDYYGRQSLKGYDVVVDDAFHARHRALFPNNRFQNQFTGIHAAVDVEFTGSRDARRDIPVTAVAAGRVIFLGSVAGYGGLIVVRHQTPEVVTTLYGHVRLRDAKVRRGDPVRQGQVLAVLGAPFSAETSGARKHLHFGVHKGSVLDIAGHEQSRQKLRAEWYNPNEWLARHGAPKLTLKPTAAASPHLSPSPAPLPEQKSWLEKLTDWFLNIFR